jgi:hypothetical protein
VNHSGAQSGSPAPKESAPGHYQHYWEEPSSEKHLVPNKVKTNAAWNFPGSAISEMAVNRVLDHLAKLFNAPCLRNNGVAQACGHESVIYIVLRYFKDDFFHFDVI